MSFFDSEEIYLYPSRTICAILENMRSMHKTHNYSQLAACIEELQYAADRMEAALSDVGDIRRIQEKLLELKTEYRKLKKETKSETK